MNKTIVLTIEEYINFKKIIKVKFDAKVCKAKVIVSCEEHCLTLIGF